MLKNKYTLFWNTFLVAFLIATFYCFSSYVMPFLHYHAQHIAFLWGNDFFSQFKSYPGGIADYTATFLMQFFYYNWAGAFIITMLVLLLYFLLQRIIKNMIWSKVWIYLFISLIIIISSNYLFHFAALVKLVLLFLFTYILTLEALKKVWFVSYVILAIGIYYIAGGAAIIVFSLNAAIIRLFNSPNIISAIWAIACMAIGLIIPFITYKFLIPLSFSNIYSEIFPDVPVAITLKSKKLTYVTYLILPFLLILKYAFEKNKKEASQTIPIEKDKKKSKKDSIEISFSLFKTPLFITCLQALVILLLGAFSMKRGLDTKLKNAILTDYYSNKEDWENARETSLKTQEYDYLTNIRYNRALYHCGMMGEKLFEYPQLLGSDALFPDKFSTGEITILSSDFYYDLGYIAESQHWAYEAQTVFPYCPMVLKRIITNNLILGNYELAEKFLNILGKNFLYNDWVKQYLKMTVDTSLVSKDPVMSQKRKLMPINTRILESPEQKLLQLLSVNPENKMAYEYLLIYYLLNIRLGDFVIYTPALKDYYKSKTPKIFEEALALYLLKTKNHDSLLDSISISQTTKNNFLNLNKLMAHYRNAKNVIEPEVRSSFGQTYWCYVLYDNPKVTKSSLSTREASDY